ncbi:exodeoxyribonuclease V subunit alpha [Biostraticola tofi]|uniref:RecBCD enzyme subunit RecD n=1 Tax=Biostraticola tofi TaxID=466109 RepID=A0A4R3YKA2_9GAMM|nr:exodeoxyribonuclease V subunit alpha [Biostraticola tofi]TCV92611.1 DNA helicase/exodeoxyribonuclease V alpha subunit [Biostraticola tofi]
MDSFCELMQQMRLWRPLDVQFARMLAGDTHPALLLAGACLSADAGAGHVCLPLSLLSAEQLFGGRHPALAQQAWNLAGKPDVSEWESLLLASEAVSDGSRPTPLVLDRQRLYLQRMWLNEKRVAHFFTRPEVMIPVDEQQISQILDLFFTTGNDTSPDWQKVAAAVALTHQVALISGGPGTGKTSTVAKLLAALVMLSDQQRLRIRMAAPTGKAAARLSESLGAALQQLGLTAAQRRLLPDEAITLHRLLGAQPSSQRMRYHQGNPLHVDVLIVDEASMVDLPMMANLIAALPAHARVIFLGDRCQLSSVEAGAVLGDLCHFAEQGYSSLRRRQLERLSGCSIPPSPHQGGHPVSDSLCLLQKSYRFNLHSGIGRLAEAVNTGSVHQALTLLKATDLPDVSYARLINDEDYRDMLAGAVAGYRDYLTRVASHKPVQEILAAFGDYRLLCALREGPFGVAGLNLRIEQALQRAGLIRLQTSGRGYAGRPVMITRNAPSLGLYNGDIGITLDNGNGELRVYFPLPDGSIRTVSQSRLPAHETAFAMTVHKSQGSEFMHTALVLPSQVLPVLSRELVYTAITRARRQLSLYGNDDVLTYAIATATQRRSGLIARLADAAVTGTPQ